MSRDLSIADKVMKISKVFGNGSGSSGGGFVNRWDYSQRGLRLSYSYSRLEGMDSFSEKVETTVKADNRLVFDQIIEPGLLCSHTSTRIYIPGEWENKVDELYRSAVSD